MAAPLRAVLIDDSSMVIKRLSMMLGAEGGVEVVGTARNGGEGVRVVLEQQPDFVVLDLMMPGMDGFATMRTLRAKLPDLRVYILTSIAEDPGIARKMQRLGAVDVLAKPFDQDLVDRLLERERAHRAETSEVA